MTATVGTYERPLESVHVPCPDCGESLRASEHAIVELILARFICKTDTEYRRFLATAEVVCRECGFRGSASR